MLNIHFTYKYENDYIQNLAIHYIKYVKCLYMYYIK